MIVQNRGKKLVFVHKTCRSVIHSDVSPHNIYSVSVTTWIQLNFLI